MVQDYTVLYPGPARRHRHGYCICDATYPRVPSQHSPDAAVSSAATRCSLGPCSEQEEKNISQWGMMCWGLSPPWTRAVTIINGLLQSSEEFSHPLGYRKHHPCFSAEDSATIATLMPVDKIPTSALPLKRNRPLKKWKHGVSPPETP